MVAWWVGPCRCGAWASDPTPSWARCSLPASLLCVCLQTWPKGVAPTVMAQGKLTYVCRGDRRQKTLGERAACSSC